MRCFLDRTFDHKSLRNLDNMRLMCDGIWITELPIVHSKCSCSSMSTRDTKTNASLTQTHSDRHTIGPDRIPKINSKFFASVFLLRTRLTITTIIYIVYFCSGNSITWSQDFSIFERIQFKKTKRQYAICMRQCQCRLISFVVVKFTFRKLCSGRGALQFRI